jgi:hypothetical protein
MKYFRIILIILFTYIITNIVLGLYYQCKSESLSKDLKFNKIEYQSKKNYYGSINLSIPNYIEIELNHDFLEIQQNKTKSQEYANLFFKLATFGLK